MKKRYVAVLVATFMTVSASMTAFAATAQDIINMNPTSYTAGTNSVYGVSSTQDQLNAVAQAVADFKTNYINDSMDNDTKIRTAYDYLVNKVSYIDWNQGEGANAAYGALVRGQAACSGYARAFKALCDAMGVSCYYIHSTGNDHQWNMVEFNDGYYFVDVQANDSSGFDWIYHSSTHPYAYDTTQFPAIASKSGQSTSGSTAVAEGWVQDATGWWYRNADGSYPANAWKEINGKWYYFEGSGYMAANKWINGTYYVGSDGAMYVNTTTPDGYQVGADGAWIQDTNTNSAIPWITPSNTDGYEMSKDWPAHRWRWKDENGNYYSNCWVNFPGSNCWIYFNTEGYSLTDTDTPDGYHVDNNGVYYAPQYNESGKRNLIAGDTVSNNIQPLEERVDINGNKYYLISSDTTSISFEYMDNIDENALILDFAAYTYSPQTNTINVFSNDGTAVYEDFQFGRVYDFKLEGVNATGSALVEYCKQNDIIIRVDVSNRIDGVGVSFLYCYE